MYLTPIKYSLIWPALMINSVNYANTQIPIFHYY